MFTAITHAVFARDRSVAANFRGGLRSYARLKLGCDPVYAEVADLLIRADLPVLDIGCGIGLLGHYLRELGFARRYYGIDCDAAKTARARLSARDHAGALTFETRDAVVLPPFAGSVVILDVLHYLERERQRSLLHAAAQCVAERGVLVLRTALQEPRWRYRATQWEERLLYGCGWMQMPARHFPLRAEIESTFDELGLRTSITPLWGRTPFASFLVVAERAARA